MRASIAFAAFGLAGCSLGTAAHLPTLSELGIPDLYSGQSAEQSTVQSDSEPWWHGFGDALLGELIERGCGDNSSTAHAAPGTADAACAKVAAGISRDYVALRAAQAHLVTLRAYIAAQVAVQDVARFREEAKLVTARDAIEAGVESDRAAAGIPTLEAEISADAGRIAVLTGQQPSALREQLATAGPIPAAPAQIAMGTPTELLAHRPEVQRAARRVARARQWGGDSKAALSGYRRAVLTALQAAEAAQARYAAAGTRVAALDKAADTAGHLAQLTRSQYRDGLADHTALAEAERTLRATRDERADAIADRARAAIDLYGVLRGDGA